MPASDLEINRLAQLLLQQHGDSAVAKARAKVGEMRRKGEDEEADTWLRVLVALGTPGRAPPTAERH